MEWSWLKDWWRLKRPRRKYRRNRAGANTEPGVADSDCEQYGDQAAGEPGTYNRHNARSRACSFDCDDETICYCDECMNGDLDSTDGLDSDDSSASGKQVVVAVCAMAKKSQSKPMKEILTRLQEFEFIKMIVFSEEIILGEPVEKWPICDCLISFHSKGFPLDKAIQYAQLRQPYVINNLHMQFDIQDRRRVYAILEKEGIEIPRYAVLDRDSPDPKQHELVESEDHVEVNGIIFNKPFVEKPVSAEDHNIYIYYPTSAGGGSQRLFRKIGSRSSVYSPESRVRKTGSFIYEDFMPTDGTDVKVYTVGPDYAHAEARKSPALDGKVERDSDGKEIRYPVILSNAEKLISRKVCLAFKQTVCGFDLLRANGKSFVCDVNGFSFVKNSNKYYDDSAKILGNMILRELAPTLHIPWSVPFQLDDPPIVPTTFGKMMELRCVTAVIRHGDRTPKQKMKVEVRHPKFFEIFEKYDGYKYGHIKLKRPKQLQEILDIARSLLAEIQTKAADSEIEEKQSKLEQLKSVLEMYGHFSGINRKVQMKYQPKGRPRGSSSDDGKHRSNAPKDPSLVLILKWGGELTPAGRIQAEELGRIFRCMYPGGQSRDGKEGLGAQGLGLLRLHSTFRHDLKIYASDEGRVQMTAAAFAKGLLALEGELTPILVQMVKSANTNGLLDNDCDSSKYQNMAKSRLHELMQIDRDFTVEDRAAINPDNAISINLAMDFVKNPVKCCAHVHSLIQSLLGVVAVKRDDPKTRDAVLYHGETWELMGRRWGKIEKDFCTKSKNYDISKIPDIYDCIKYDLQHNQHTLQFDLAEELYIYAKYLADVVIPQEYGLTVHEKLTIGQGICTPLLKKIRADLQRNIEEVGDESVNRLNPRYSHGVSSPGRHVRTRLYFTSESHVHSLLTVLRYGGLLNVLTDEQWRRAMEYVSMVSELNYMSQIVIMLYEDPTKDPCSEERFHVELHFSPGVNCCVQKNLPPGPGFRPHSRNDSVTSKNASGDEESTSRIDEENDTEEENSHGSCQTLSKENSFTETFKNKDRKIRKIKSSEPIPIGSCHTVSGHEAMDLAKRLSEEIAAQQQTGLQRPLSPDEPRAARSFEHGKHGRIKGEMSSAIIEPECAYEKAMDEIRFSSTEFSQRPDTLRNDFTWFDSHNTLGTNNKIREHYAQTTILTIDEIPSTCQSFFVRESYSCDSIDEFRPNMTDQDLYVSSFSDTDSETSRYYSACHDFDPFHYKYPLSSRALSYTFSNDPEKDNLVTPFGGLGYKSLFCPSLPQISKSFDDLDYLTDADTPRILENGSTITLLFQGKPSTRSPCVRFQSQKLANADSERLKSGFPTNVSGLFRVASDPGLPIRSLDYFANHLDHAQSAHETITFISLTSPPPDEMLTDITLDRSFKVLLDRAGQPVYSDKMTTVTSDQDSKPINTAICTTTNNNSNNNLAPNRKPQCSKFVKSYTTDNSAIPSGGCSVAVVGGGGSGGVCQASSSHGSSHSSTGGATVRRQRHSIAGQMSYFKMLGGFGKKMATSTNSLFSTAVISGSSSAPNLRDMIPSTASPSAIEGFGGVPPIRPLETLHNALSLRQLDHFLEKMTTGPLFKTPASSPPKYPSTPLPTPTPSPAIPERSVLPTASWSGHSSMTSSMSAMSSGGPSSPNYSDMLSRGCPSSDMSASITSTDGSIALAAGGGTRDNMPKIFPMIDNDLNVLGSHFNYDQLAASINLESSAKIPPISKDGTLDISGDLTPISTCSDWEFNTNDATKGSTNTNNDLTAEDDDEDATISTDTCLSTGEITAASEESNTTPNLNITLGSTSSSKTVQKEFLFDMKNIKHDMSILRSEDLVPSSSASSYSTEVIPKIENRLRGNRIQKQISLYEKDLRTEAKNLSHELNKFGERSATSLKRTASCNAPETSHSHMSFEELQKDFPNIEKNLVSKFEHEQEKCSKSSKSVSTRLNNSPTPGALVIREGFIEPPRITRVPKSFHGKTDHHQIQVNDLARRASDLARPSSSVSALAPTALQFCGRDSANKYNKNQIRQSINTISVSNSTKTGTHTVGNAGPNGANAGLGRFTTSIVQEPPAGIMETVQRADTNTGMNQFAGDVLTASSTVGVGQSEKLPQQSSQDRADTEK
ncbi:inositol hexakisphosphate and diphosphoinositol-pentakisphosphate kinase isoform X4 [Toxorhynchites rutilus septentrionalis]|uniref:inositol hexakisphosphate and diphosphoinositol-pentakisphosphate kinase isoform X4 n=1 Tax=Toxorhynchites rutilus septentrionalis TaxID=329112 RepID=UPI00247A7EAB|nr:inositol hexakisphosphate and diphosphoinositol-pentakisphosphate kinase isoform X4 [Toxorhynchites rutilus septentrionalis]